MGRKVINPFAYFESDPNGYIRHLIVGVLTFALLKTFNLKIYWLLILAISKECFDLLAKANFDLVDIMFTISPILMETMTYIFLGIALLIFATLLIFQ